jgi:glutamine synthetase adenylyltransferase
MRKRLYPTSFSGLNAITDVIKGRGGVTDVEFINQYLLLLNPEYLKFCIGKGNRQILEYLKLEELKSVPIQDEEDTAVQSERYRDYNKLLEGFKFLRKVRLSIQCVYHLESNLFPSKQKGEVLYKFLNYESYEELAKAVQSTLKQNNEIFRQIFNG